MAIIQDLMIKSQDIFLDHFARLGIFSKVQTLAGPLEVQENEENEQTNEGLLGLFFFFVHFLLENFR